MIGRGRAGLLLCLALSLGMAGPVSGGAMGEIARTDHVEARLSSSVPAVAPGESFTLGLEQKIAPGWHTYWRNPGDSGAPITLELDLPEGVAASPIRWPAPQAIPYFDLMNYGYEDEAFLTTRLGLPEDWPAGRPLPIRATATWLVCADICIPETAGFDLAIPTADGAVTGRPARAESEIAARFRAAEAKLPKPSPWPVAFAMQDERLHLLVEGDFADYRIKEAHFFPFSSEVIVHAAEQRLEVTEQGLVLELERQEDGAAPEPLEGVFTLTEDLPDGPLRQAFTIRAQPGAVIPGGTLPQAAGIGLIKAVLLALLGGLILNLMPCVFPVLSIKALHLVRHAGAPGLRRQGLAYTGGVLATFAGLALLLIGLRAAGAALGWGFQLQSPPVIALLAYLMFAIGLWLMGAVAFGDRLIGLGGGLAGRRGLAGSFFTGALAVVVATPCTAPFMATATGFALTQNALSALLIFLALGLGLALPYLALSLSPGLQRLLPRPGAWMERFKQLLAFPMYATAAWLVWVLSRQVGPHGLLIALSGFVLIGFAAWLLRIGGRLPHGAAAAALALALGLTAFAERPAASRTSAPAPGEEAVAGAALAFTPERLEALLAEERAVFVNITAAWCITCLVNERVALKGKAFKEALATKDIAYLKGDWTSYDAEITAYLASFGRSGVPLYVFYPGDGAAPALLPQLLTEDIVLTALAARPLAAAP